MGKTQGSRFGASNKAPTLAWKPSVGKTPASPLTQVSAKNGLKIHRNMDLARSDSSRRCATCAGCHVCTQGALARNAAAQTKKKKSQSHQHHPCSQASNMVHPDPHLKSLPSSHLCSMPITASPSFYYLTKTIINSNKRCLAKPHLQWGPI